MSTSPDLCYVDGSTVTVQTPFGKSGHYQFGQAPLSFQIDNQGTNPGSDVLAGPYTGVETYAVEGGLAYIIDKLIPSDLPADKLLSSTYIQSVPACPLNSGKFCDATGTFNPLFKFHQFEGSIALLQSGIFITQDESRSMFLNTNPNTCSGLTQSQNALLTIMQVGNNRNEFDQNTFIDQMFPYVNTNSYQQVDPFIGGIFSFERCSFVMNMALDQTGTQRLYNMKRYKISIEHDNTVHLKKTVVNIDKEWTRS